MKNLRIWIVIAIFSSVAECAWSQVTVEKLPPCQGTEMEKWTNCFGEKIYAYYEYKGEFLNGSLNRIGRYRYKGDRSFEYIGQYSENSITGYGIKKNKNGTIEEGWWQSGKLVKKSKVDFSKIFSVYDYDAGEILGQLLYKNGANQIDFAAITKSISKRMEAERLKKEQEINNVAQTKPGPSLNLQIQVTQPDVNGVFEINIKVNSNISSLKINEEEQGPREPGTYVIKRIARIGQETKLLINAVDYNGLTDSKTVTVVRQSIAPSANLAQLKPNLIKQLPPRDAVAIIIGIQNYKRIAKADFANQDAQDFYDYAIRAIGIKPENIKLLTDADADDVEITKAFQNWLPLKVKKNKTDVYVFYSGHGLPSEDGKSLYILPYGVDRDLINKTAINQQEIVTALQAAQPKTVTMFIDSCYSGQTRVGETLIAGIKPIALKAKEMGYPPEFTVITASQPDQLSLASTELKHGIFSYYLMKGMEGDADENKDGKITLGEMQTYLADMVPRQAMTMNRKQMPQLTGDGNRVLVGR